MARAAAVLGTILAALSLAAPAAAHKPRGSDPSPLVRGRRVSGLAQKFAHRSLGTGSGFGTGGTTTTCSTPGSGNWLADCHSGGAPVNEPSLAASPDGSLLVAGANDYNSYNGQGQDGFYWSSDGKTWNDAGPLDVFPHDPNNGAGDPGVAVDANGVVYYSSIFFNFNHCDVGGVELMRRDPATGNWSRYEIASDSSTQFQDKPALAADSSHAYVSWTQFGSCDGNGVASPIKVAVFPLGGASVAPLDVLSVPGSTYSQGSALAPDGNGGVWVAWEEFPTSTNSVGAIKLAHWDGAGWNTPQTVSPPSFKDLPSPLSGFAFRTNSFPSIALVGGRPVVAWASADNGAGRVSVWSGGSVTQLVSSGGDQFFPSVTPDGSGGYYAGFGQTSANGTYDWYLAHGSDVSRVSTVSTSPSGDFYFGGKFLGDYSSVVAAKGVPHAAWADVRAAGLFGYRTDVMTSSPAPPPPPPSDFSLSVSPDAQTVNQGASATYQVNVTPTGGFSSPVNLSASGLPTGATFAFSPNPTSSTSTLTLTTTSQTPAGTYTFSVLGFSGSTMRTATATVTVQASAQPDFSLSASPATQSVSSGGAASYGVSIARTGGFAGSVTLSASGLPSGATFSFSPNPATSSATLTVQTASSSPAGTYTVTIFGLSGSTSRSTTATLVVQSNGGDFSLSASPSSRTVNQGASATYGITIVPSGGFNGQVSLSATGLPSGATFTFSPTPATSSSTLTIAAGAATPSGTYTVTVNGLSGSLSHSTTVALVVQAGSPPDFSLSLSPSSQAVTAGAAANYTVTVNPVGGFSGSVSLSASGLPSGAYFSFNPSPATTSSTMTIQTVPSSPPGTYTMTVYGLSGSLFRTTTATLVVR